MVIEDIRSQAIAHFVDFDFANDEDLQEIVDTAAAATKSSYAIVTFLDEHNQYIKVAKGTVATTVPREKSFCTHALALGDLLVVSDTLDDPRFVNHPMVIDGPRIRFFASIPLILKDGQVLGTLCVLDSQPHELDGHQQLVIKILSKQVIKIVELRAGTEMLEKNRKELQEQKQLNNDANIRLRSFFESSTNFQVLLGRGGEVIDFNKTAYNFVRTVHKAVLKRGDQIIKYIHPEFAPTFLSQYDLALGGTRSAKEGSTDYDEMGIIWWEASFEAAKDDNDNIIGVSYLIRNVTERKLKEQKIISQNQSLLKIAHIQAHEFRAPLTTIMGLMSLIKEDSFNPPSEYIQFLEQAVEALDTTIRHVVSNIDEQVINDYVGELQRD